MRRTKLVLKGKNTLSCLQCFVPLTIHVNYLKLVNTHINSIYTMVPIFGSLGSGQNNNSVLIDTTDDPDTSGHCPGGGGTLG